MNKELLEQAAIACQTLVEVAYYMTNVNGGVKDKDVESTVYWQERQSHWRRVGMQYLMEAMMTKEE
jgi:hypothetical protein